MFIIKPELSSSKYKRQQQVKALFLEWVVDIETRALKKTAGLFVAFFGIASYVRHMKALIKGLE